MRMSLNWRSNGAFRGSGFVSVCGIWARNVHSGSSSPRARFGVSFLMRGAEQRGARQDQTAQCPACQASTPILRHRCWSPFCERDDVCGILLFRAHASPPRRTNISVPSQPNGGHHGDGVRQLNPSSRFGADGDSGLSVLWEDSACGSFRLGASRAMGESW
jgi:hypothetical protein